MRKLIASVSHCRPELRPVESVLYESPAIATLVPFGVKTALKSHDPVTRISLSKPTGECLSTGYATK